MYKANVQIPVVFMNRKLNEHFDSRFMENDYYGQLVIDYVLELANEAGDASITKFNDQPKKESKNSGEINVQHHGNSYIISFTSSDQKQALQIQKVLGNLHEEWQKSEGRTRTVHKKRKSFWDWLAWLGEMFKFRI